MTFVDTNILLYAISTQPDEAGKCQKAKAILSDADLTLSVQVLQEFYVQATRPTRSDPLTHQEATALIQYWLRHRIVPLTVQVMQDALDIKKRYQTSYWDAAILAAAASAGCSELLSEDLNPGQSYDSVRRTTPSTARKSRKGPDFVGGRQQADEVEVDAAEKHRVIQRRGLRQVFSVR